LPYDGVVSIAEHPNEPHLRRYTVDDPALWDARPQMSREELTIEGLSDEEWDTFHKIIAEA
jgi:hypothetical protein